jgi:hypothetical protein
MTHSGSPNSDDLLRPVQPSDEAEPVLTTPEDVASAGRSCMAIIFLGLLIALVVVLWVVYRTLNPG